MNLKKALIDTGSRILRFIGIIAILYVSMVFYLALCERRNAFPRAISHKEAREAIAKDAKVVSCTLEDGAVLNGWTMGEKGKPSLLYFPGADEDAAQFLAEMSKTEELQLITFNYRGGADNKGTPSQETFEPDANSISECAAQAAGGHIDYLAGRGTGAILAAEQLKKSQILILIDPVNSIADALAAKYRILYPKFIVRADVKMPISKLENEQEQIKILHDRKNMRDGAHILQKQLPKSETIYRTAESFKEVIVKNIQKN